MTVGQLLLIREVMIRMNNQVKERLKQFQEKSHYQFKDTNLLATALTHSSYANENRRNKLLSNERLEFLGDAVLNIIISDYIYAQYPHLPEGELTRIRASVVCEESLAQCAKELQFGTFLLLGKGEEMTGGRKRHSILSDAFEAVLASIYLDGSFKEAQKWALNQLKSTIKAAADGTAFRDYKTLLQELIQKNSDDRIEYIIVKESGPDHNKDFYVEIRHGNNVIGKGEGKSKKQAEQNAAKSALEMLQAKA